MAKLPPKVEVCSENPPRYVEAYPRFNILEAKAAREREEEICHFISSRGYHVGFLFLSEDLDDAVTLEFELGWSYLPMARGRVTLPWEIVPNGLYRFHIALRCPKCEKRKSSLIFKERWRCAKCHNLKYRSQLVDRGVRDWERYLELRGLVGKGRPFGMHSRTYHRLVTELEDLKRRCRRPWPAYVSVAHSHVITSEWRSLDDSREILQSRGCPVTNEGIEMARDYWSLYRDFTEDPNPF